jgi:hypothetical protein
MPPSFPSRLLRALACVALVLGVSSLLAESAIWNQIMYPPLTTLGTRNGRMSVIVESGGSMGGKRQLQFLLLWDTDSYSGLPEPIAKPSDIVVKLHTGDGKVTLPESPRGWTGGGSRGMTYNLDYTFPWSRNALDEAWIELHVAGQTYWLELPYGFIRNPADPEPTDADRSYPEFPPAMKNLTDKDILVPWLHVDYDLSEPQNHWRFSLRLSNPGDARAEIILYRDSTPAGRSRYPWKLEAPVTSMQIEWPGSTITGRKITIHLREDDVSRSDIFKFNRDGSSEKGRGWGTVQIKVDDDSYSLRVPSSLFKCAHGVTDSGNAHRMEIPRPE